MNPNSSAMLVTMRTCALWIYVVSFMLALNACDYKVRELKPGKSTANEVRDVLGAPSNEWKASDGSRQWEFARGPQGTVTYMAFIGPDDVLRELHQVLSSSWFAKLQPGMGKNEVRKLIGRPGETMSFPARREEVWTWRYEDGPAVQYQFNAHFDLDGRLVQTSTYRIGEPQ
ncbi:MAG: hypothetical protein ACKVQU_21270 [Burkholderiales bacterium]